MAPVRKENNDRSEIVTQLMFGELLEVLEQAENWMQIQTFHDHYQGWIDSKQILFLSEKEARRWMDGISISTSLVREILTPWGKQHVLKGSYISIGNQTGFSIGKAEFRFNSTENEQFETQEGFALSYLNTPYLWGGKGPFGIDCSGFMQQVFRFSDIQLPRDAYQQEEMGQNVAFEDRQAGDLAFFSNSAGKVIHVGLLLNDLRIIHASGWVRIDEMDSNGIQNKELSKQTHQLFSIKRL